MDFWITMAKGKTIFGNANKSHRSLPYVTRMEPYAMHVPVPTSVLSQLYSLIRRSGYTAVWRYIAKM